MSDFDSFPEKSFKMSENINTNDCNSKLSSRQSLRAKFEKECAIRENTAECSDQLSRTGGTWCDALSLSVSNVNAKQVWKTGTEKLSQTINNVRTTFGTLSQKIKKSTKRRQPLINIDSPKTPVTPYTRSKALLGRTPTKLYSPFKIDTPTGKENFIYRPTISKSSSGGSLKALKKKFNKTKSCSQIAPANNFTTPEKKLSGDLLQTQIGIYEFQSVANKIVQNGLKN